ncbi:MAG: DUF1476 domain-containing protein [Alphaproteobacteria bacterium]|nr:DUF1476 domain-containing protein [Alphaproteobacteria bacterium]MBN9496658.1 DUF1476 domain-containing protein [Alphaproteobacteria bacterium]
MTSFDDRKSAFENKFKHDQEVQFKVNARRNKLVGLWAAEKLGKTGPDADAYAKDVVASDFDKAGDDDVIEKLEADLKGKGVSVADIKAQLAHFLPIAKQQIMEQG